MIMLLSLQFHKLCREINKGGVLKHGYPTLKSLLKMVNALDDDIFRTMELGAFKCVLAHMGFKFNKR